jgi:hypothetical protein
MLKRIIYLSDYELRVFLLKGKHLIEEAYFQTSSEESKNKFADYLNETAKTPIELLIDTTQEEYKVVNIPHVRGKDHRDLMTQKLRRFFQDMPYTYGVVQKREREGRRDDRVLLMAINNPDLLAPWLSIITRLNVPLLGIYSLPLLSQDLLKYLPKAPYTLIVAHTPPIRLSSPAGLRQSFFIEQKLQFSRLIPSPQPDDSAAFVLKQIITIRHYLESARILPETEPATQLSVVILSNGVLLGSLKDAIKDVSSSLGVKIHLLDNSDLAQQMGMTGKWEQWELLHFVALQFLRRQRNHYAPDTSYLFYHRLRIIIYLSAALLLSGATVASTIILKNAWILQEKGEELANQTAQRLIAIENTKQKQPNLAVDIRLIRAVVDVGSQLKARSILPRTGWEKLSGILNQHPDLFLERLEWGIVSSKDFFEMIKLSGKIKPFEGNYQKALVVFKKFINDLKLNNFEKVNIVVSPYNPKKVLRGEVGLSNQNEVDNQNAPFVVDVVIRH